MKCPKCGAEIPVGSKVCEYCRTQITYEMQREQEQLNKEGCPKCHSSNIEFKRENQGEVRGKNSKSVIHRTVGFCKDCGFTWYPNSASQGSKNNNTIWWVLGWLFFFPAPVMILIWRKKNTWDIKIKIAVTIVFWLLFFIFAASGSTEETESVESPVTMETIVEVETGLIA